MAVKLVIGDKSGKSLQKELSDEETKFFYGKRIGDKFKGEIVDLTGYEFEITGGSNNAGFPMRRDLPGFESKRIFSTGGVGFRKKRRGEKLRKRVVGNTINEKIAQINVKVVKSGSKPLFEDKKQEEEKKQENKN